MRLFRTIFIYLICNHLQDLLKEIDAYHGNQLDYNEFKQLLS